MKYHCRKLPYPQNLIHAIEYVYSVERNPVAFVTEDQEKGLQYVLSLLEERSRTFLLQYFQQGMTFSRISEINHVSVNTPCRIVREALEFLSVGKNFGYIRYGYEAFSAILAETNSSDGPVKTLADLRSAYLGLVCDAYYNAKQIIEGATFVPLSETALTSRTRNTLGRSGIRTISELLTCSDNYLMQFRCLGKGCLAEIHRFLDVDYRKYLAIV